jgi:hypothetical protein
MKKLLVIAAVCVLTTACAKKAPLTPEEQWRGYCTSIGNAGRSIMLDWQNGIEKEKAVEHANKVEDPTTKAFVLDAIEQVYALDTKTAKDDVTARRDAFKNQLTEKCLATPHQEMPDYKPF